MSRRSRILLTLLLWGPAADGHAKTWIFPLDGTPRVTSTFGEYRPGHYHGGLDFSTGGFPGRSVRAPADGWVYRLRASGVGYGRAVYLRLDDGETVVFAHLEQWRKDIQEAVEGYQHEMGRYEVDWYPPPGEFRFRAGEVIARTGSSGAGPPHLHAEVRTGGSADLAVNPLQFGWGVPDTSPPVIPQVLVEPLRVESRIEGRRQPATVTLAADALAEIHTWGPVRFWVSASDPTEGGRLGLAALRVRLDGALVLSLEFESFDWNSPGEVEWTYHEALARKKNEPWIRLDAPGPSPNGIYTKGGIPDRIEGAHILSLVAVDQGGNQTKRDLKWVVQRPRNDWVRSSGAVGRAVTGGGFLEYELPGGEKPSPGFPGHTTKEGGGQARNVEAGIPEGLPGVAAVLPDTQHRLVIPGLYVDFPRASVYEAVFVTASMDSQLAEVGRETELVPISPVFFLAPWALPLKKRIEVGIMSLHSDQRTAIYSQDGDEWRFEGAEPIPGGLRAGIRNLENLALFRDAAAPRVTIQPPDGSPRPLLRARIVETGSGVTWRTLSMSLDQRELVAEWDPESSRLTGYLNGSLKRGNHELGITALDRSGNRTVATSTFFTGH